MRCRIPADPRRKQIRKRAQAALFRRTMSRTIRVQTVRNAAHVPPLFCRAICSQCRARSATLPSRSLCAVTRTTRRSSAVQSVCNVAHNPLPNVAPQVVQSDADATCLQLRVVATATSRNAAAKRKTASGVRDQENNMESGTKRLQLHSDTRVASCGV